MNLFLYTTVSSATGNVAKSIQICEVRNNQVVEVAEHPLTLTENTANVEEVTTRIGEEAFQGMPIRLLNAKNLPLPDCDGTRGESCTNTRCIEWHEGMYRWQTVECYCISSMCIV